MSEKIQKLKKPNCDHDCPACRVLNIAQMRIGSQRLTEYSDIMQTAQDLQQERCPDGVKMQTQLLNPARTKSKRRYNVWS